MFLRKTMTKKLFKTAAKTENLKVGMNDEGYYVVYGGSWMINTKVDRTPNWFKSLIVEHAGKLPENAYDLYEVFTDGSCQMGMFTEYYNIDNYKRSAYGITPVVIEDGHMLVRIAQDMTTHVLHGMYNSWFDLIDLSEIDANVENAPFGPIVTTSGLWIWKNDTTSIAIMAGAKLDRVQDIVDTLSDIVFSERRE